MKTYPGIEGSCSLHARCNPENMVTAPNVPWLSLTGVRWRIMTWKASPRPGSRMIAELFAMSILVAFLCLPLYSLYVASIFDDWFAAMANAVHRPTPWSQSHLGSSSFHSGFLSPKSFPLLLLNCFVARSHLVFGSAFSRSRSHRCM